MYDFASPLSYPVRDFTRRSRYVFREDGTFTLQYPNGEYRGTYTDVALVADLDAAQGRRFGPFVYAAAAALVLVLVGVVWFGAQRDVAGRARLSSTVAPANGDASAIDDDISRSVANTLRLRLAGGHRRHDTDLRVYELYWRARALMDRQGAASAFQAIDLFKLAIARDPAFALAYAGLADAYARASQDIPGPRSQTISPDTALTLMRPAVERALELDPWLAEAHAARGLLRARERVWEEADASFRRAIDLDASLSAAYTDDALSVLLPLGKLSEAEQFLETALRADPLSLKVRRAMADVQIALGQYEKAIGHLRRIEAVDPAFRYADLHMARALTFAGRLDEALPRWEARKDEPGWQHWMAPGYVLAGRRDLVERLARTHTHPYRLAIIYAALGDRDRALEALDRAADIVPHRVGLLTVYPELASLRDDLRFAAVRRKLGLPPLSVR